MNTCARDSRTSRPEDSQLENAKKSPVGDIGRAYELALRQRDFEISQLTNRNNFFMIFQGVLIAGLVQSQGRASPLLNFSLCFFGMVLSMYQAWMAGGAKYWQIRWECAVKELEIRLLIALKNEPFVMQLFSVDAKHVSRRDVRRLSILNLRESRRKDRLSVNAGFVDKLVSDDLKGMDNCSLVKHMILARHSVSKIPIYVGMALTCFWAVLWLNTFTFGGKTLMRYLYEWIDVPWFRLASLA